MSAAFTLIEVLIAVGIIVIILSLSVPAIMGTVKATRITQAGDMVMTLFSEAQETANTMGRPVEIRLYQTGDSSYAESGSPPYDSLMILEYYQPGENDPRIGLGAAAGAALTLTTPLAVVSRPVARLPIGIFMSPTTTLSTLTSSPDLDPSKAAGAGGIEILMRQGMTLTKFSNSPQQAYKTFMVLPGSTSLSASPGSKWFVTVVDSQDLDKSVTDLRNFYTIQMDPVTGRLSKYRPN